MSPSFKDSALGKVYCKKRVPFDNDCSQLLRNHSYRLNLRAEYGGVREIRELARIYSVETMVGMKEGRI